MDPKACCKERGVALNKANSLWASAMAVLSNAISLSKPAFILWASANAFGRMLHSNGVNPRFDSTVGEGPFAFGHLKRGFA
jgi:hypothetical protein